MSKLCLIAVLLCLVGALVGANILHADDPFTQGTTIVRLTPMQRESLSSYIEVTRDRLERVVEDARGMPLPEAELLYTNALILIVMESYRLEGRTELLTRYVINQGLEMAYGVPSADGKELAKRGVLPTDVRYQGLRVLVLEDSVKMALSVLPEDKKVLEDGELIDLPFIPFAYTRLKVARMWSAAIFSEKTQYLFMLKLLDHWLSTVASSDQLHQARLASHILEVEQILRQENLKLRAKDLKYMSSRLRDMRKLVRRVLEQEARSVDGLPYPEVLKKYSQSIAGARAQYEDQEKSALVAARSEEDERRKKDRIWRIRSELSASVNLNNEKGGAAHFELDRVLRDTKAPAYDGRTIHIDLKARAYKTVDATSFSRSQVRARVMNEAVDSAKYVCKVEEEADGICDESKDSWASFVHGGAVFKRNAGTTPEWTENSISAYTIGLRWNARTREGYFVKGDIGIAQPGLNVTAKTDGSGFQLRYFDASLEAGYRAGNGFKLSNRFNTSLGHGNYIDHDAYPGMTFFGEIENELKVRLPHMPVYASWTAERQSVKHEAPGTDSPVKPWRSNSQHMFNMGIDF